MLRSQKRQESAGPETGGVGAGSHLTEGRTDALVNTVLTAPPLSYYIGDLVLFFWLYHQN